MIASLGPWKTGLSGLLPSQVFSDVLPAVGNWGQPYWVRKEDEKCLIAFSSSLLSLYVVAACDESPPSVSYRLPCWYWVLSFIYNYSIWRAVFPSSFPVHSPPALPSQHFTSYSLWRPHNIHASPSVSSLTVTAPLILALLILCSHSPTHVHCSVIHN